jgi:CheY-like chemotaxis protein
MARILVIEDNAETARMVTKLLRKTTHEVDTSLTGEEGLTKIFETLPDLILIDLGLPDLDGQTVISLIRQQPALANTRIIAFTAWPTDSAREMVKAYGCDGIITKPIDTRLFASQIERYLPKTQDLNGKSTDNDPVK